MYTICKNVIDSQRYELTAMLTKLDTLWVQGSMTDEQHDELVKLAREKADPMMSVDLLKRVEALEAKVHKMEQSESKPAPEEYKDYVEGQSAYNGEKYRWKGSLYQCVLPKGVVVCVWSPDSYPAYWKKII